MRIDMIKDINWVLKGEDATKMKSILADIRQLESKELRATWTKILADCVREDIGTKNVLAFGSAEDEDIIIVKEFPLEAQSDIAYPLHMDKESLYILTEEAIVISERTLDEITKSLEATDSGTRKIANY